MYVEWKSNWVFHWFSLIVYRATWHRFNIESSCRRVVSQGIHVISIMLIGVNTQWRACSCIFAPFQIRGLLMLKFDYFCNYCIGSLGLTSHIFWIYFIIFEFRNRNKKTKQCTISYYPRRQLWLKCNIMT